LTSEAAELRAREQDKICSLLVGGLSLNRVCKLRNMPAMTTVMRWLREDAAFARQYALARESQADTLADRIIDLADKVTPWSANADRVRIDALKWVAAKLKPQKYGDRLDLALPPASPDPVTVPNQIEVGRRLAYSIARAAHLEEQKRREPRLLEGRAETVEPAAPAPAPEERPMRLDPVEALKKHGEDLERVRQETMHITPGERGGVRRDYPRAITGRRPLTGGRGEE